MNWLLVFVISGSPVQTDLIFPSMSACMTYERSTAAALVERANATISQMKTAPWPQDKKDQNLAFVMGQMYSGTCIPTVRPVTVK